MSIVVTGATGHLGRHVVEQLLEKVPAEQITAVVRDESKAADLAARGVRLAVADYNTPETFDGLFAAGDKVLLISGNEFDKGRVEQHRVVIDAAGAAGVSLLAYTSAPGSLTAALADDHRATEEVLLASGLPYTLLRNGWYHENYTENLAPVLAHSAVVQAGRQGRVASASRADYAAAAVAVLTGEGHENATYELSGDEAWGFAEYAAELSRRDRQGDRLHLRPPGCLHRHPRRRRAARGLRRDPRGRRRVHREGRAGRHHRRPVPPDRPSDHADRRVRRGGAEGLTPARTPGAGPTRLTCHDRMTVRT